MKKLDIKVVGPKNPCKRCRSTKSLVEKVVKEQFTPEQQENIDITHVDVSAPETIQQYGVLETPAVVVNDTVITEGKVPKKDHIEQKFSNLD